MLADGNLDAVLIATPSASHEPMVRAALERNLHVFCEKPFCLDWTVSEELAAIAKEKSRVTQVGYHYRHVGAFMEMRRLLELGAIGKVTHVLAEAYGPVVLKPKRKSWRTDKSVGGGCLYDYAAHPLNLLNWFFGTPDQVTGCFVRPVLSADADDEVYATLVFNDGPVGQLSVNWSDESHRKMATKITLIGTKGRMYADRQECQVYLREEHPDLPDYQLGWNVKYTTELTEEAGFYLRGEEYSRQIEQFVKAINENNGDIGTDFAGAAMTDKTIAMILESAETGMPVQAQVGVASGAKPANAAAPKKGWLKAFGNG